MQIHELNNFTGTLGSGAYLAVDDGNDTGKLSTQQLLAATEARIDNIIAGPAPSAEEIVDARLGDDGVTYPSLGDAIRDQFSDVKDDLSNLYHPIKVVADSSSFGTNTHLNLNRIVVLEDYIIHNDIKILDVGCYFSSGEPITDTTLYILDTNYKITAKYTSTPDENYHSIFRNITINEDSLIALSGSLRYGAGSEGAPNSYDILSNWLSSLDLSVGSTISVSELGWYAFNLYIEEYTGTIEAIKALRNKKITIIGDSLTARPKAATWKRGIEDITGGTVVLIGVSGRKIQGSEGAQSICTKYTDAPADSDIIIIEGGTNDWGGNGNLGTHDITDFSNTGLYSALNVLYKGLQDNYPKAKIYQCTPPQRDYTGSSGDTPGMGTNAMGWTFAQCQQAIKEVAYDWGVEIIDFFAELGWSANNVADFTDDGLHPNVLGYKRMVTVTCKHINEAVYGW